MRHPRTFGGQGAPKVPDWLVEPDVEKGQHQVPVPPWLTIDWWNAQPLNSKCRSIRWFTQTHDDNGKPLHNPKETYTVDKAASLLVDMSAKAPYTYDPSVEIDMIMNLDNKFPDQQIRCSIQLPHSTGKQVRVAVFCSAEDEEEVEKLGAYICGKALEKAIEEENLEFDVLLAKSAMMPRLARLGRILGPRKLMPSPKSGTVVSDFAEAIPQFQSSRVEVRTDVGSSIKCVIGKLSLGPKKLADNYRAVMQGLADNAPPGAKKEYWKKAYMSSSQLPAISISPAEWPIIKPQKKR